MDWRSRPRTTSCRQPDDDHRPALYVPARSRRVRQRPAVGGHRVEEAGVPARQAFDDNLTSYKHRRTDSPAVLVQRAAHRVERHREPRRVAHGGLGAVLRVEADRAGGRAAAGLAGGDAARGVRPDATARPRRELHPLLRAKAGLVKILGPEPPVSRRQQRHCRELAAREAGHGRGGVFWQTQGSGKSLSMVFFAQKILRRSRATGRSWW